MSRTIRSPAKVQWQNNQDGSKNAIVSANQVNSIQLKEYLDFHYPGQYSVQLKRDKFKITVADAGVSHR
ncbi:uncharacterized protein CTRU02_204845 [Colletotrichum truncatum]|uniref:Uncharacterized protein n=1 Tax=Colletotrichum truncatum TaxID=5467 RepID=A0ACC3ZDU0_COLTU|nr:uncharacterized protein CTRU02_03080 [Colletotrichum truncatum]KAF6798038.1 hypothetical protein CTRU02_03080 [Colletotrichum truncatum]